MKTSFINYFVANNSNTLPIYIVVNVNFKLSRHCMKDSSIQKPICIGQDLNLTYMCRSTNETQVFVTVLCNPPMKYVTNTM